MRRLLDSLRNYVMLFGRMAKTKYKEYVEKMLIHNKELFDDFRKIHDKYILDQENLQNEYNKIGQRYFRLVASSGYNYLDTKGIVWSHGLKDAVFDGAAFKVVLESPFSEHAYARALASGIKLHHWQEKVDLHHLKEITEKYKVEVKVTSFPVNCSLFFTSEDVFYDPYLWALPEKEERVENHFWVFDFKKIEDRLSYKYECYNLLEKHFNFLFEHGIPLKDFLGENDENYNKLTDEFPQKLIELKKKGY